MPHRRPFKVPAPIVAIVNWLFPGAGYLLLGQITRGLTIGFTIIALFVLGILIGGIHVVDPPVFGPATGTFLQTTLQRAHLVLEKPSYIGQFLAGAIGVISGWLGPAQPASHARSNDIGTLYTAVAGMLNLLATIDAAHRSTLPDPPADSPPNPPTDPPPAAEFSPPAVQPPEVQL